MKQLKKTASNLFIVDMAEVKEGIFNKEYFNLYDNSVWEYRPSPCPLPYWGNIKTLREIIGQFIPELPDIAPFDLPKQEVDVDELAIAYKKDHPKASSDVSFAFADGFKLLSEMNKDKQFTLQDIEEAIEFGLQYTFDQRFVGEYTKDKDKFIQSLHTSRYDGLEVEIVTYTDTVISGGLYEELPTGLKSHKTEVPLLSSTGKIQIKII